MCVWWLRKTGVLPPTFKPPAVAPFALQAATVPSAAVPAVVPAVLPAGLSIPPQRAPATLGRARHGHTASVKSWREN
eukprot:382851-Prorocentrum_minimum.AAC.1